MPLQVAEGEHRTPNLELRTSDPPRQRSTFRVRRPKLGSDSKAPRARLRPGRSGDAPPRLPPSPGVALPLEQDEPPNPFPVSRLCEQGIVLESHYLADLVQQLKLRVGDEPLPGPRRLCPSNIQAHILQKHFKNTYRQPPWKVLFSPYYALYRVQYEAHYSLNKPSPVSPIRNIMIPLWSQIITLLLSCALLSLLVAAILMAAMRWVQQQRVSFSEAFLAALAGAFPVLILLFLVQSVVVKNATGAAVSALMSLTILSLGFFLQSAAIRWRFRIAFGRACVVSLVLAGIGLGLTICLGVLMLLVRHPSAAQR